MTNRIAILLSVMFLSTAGAQDQLWVRQFGTIYNEDAYALAPDSVGGVFVAGATSGNLFGTFAGGGLDAWLARCDSAGIREWGRQIGSGGDDQALAVAPDSSAGTFVAGYTESNLGGGNLGGADAWLARYDGAGNRAWICQIGTSGSDRAFALAPNGAGGVFVAGYTSGSLAGTNSGCYDAWLARYDSAGNQTWIRQFGTVSCEFVYALASDGAGGVFIAGYTLGSLGGPSAGGPDAWLARYDNAGGQTWIRQFGTSGEDLANALAPDGAGGVFIAGWTTGNLGGPNLGGQDAWLAQYDSAGNQVWIRQPGTSAADSAYAITPVGSGGAFIAGYTNGSLGGPFAGGFFDAWLAQYDSAGNQVGIRQLGTIAADRAYALAPDGTGGAFVAGDTSGNLGGPNAGSPGTYDLWLAHYGPVCLADYNHDGFMDGLDYDLFNADFESHDPVQQMHADLNGDGFVDGMDYDLFNYYFEMGC